MKWNNEEVEKLKELVSDGYRIKEISDILNRTNRSVERKIQNLNLKLNYKYYELVKCLECNISFESLISHTRKFCSKSCSAKNSNSNRIVKHEFKNYKCKSCGNDCKSKIDASNIKCDKCKLKICKYCKEKTNLVCCKRCKPFSNYIAFYKKIDVFEENIPLYEINKNVVDILEDLYYNKFYSRKQISDFLKTDKKTIFNFFIKNNFIRRTHSESISNAIFTGRLKNVSKNQYKSGYHINWENKKFYYRSSYELNYCILLDDNKISYEMEHFRIKYFDTILNKTRVSIPDFYLPKTNEIIEIKSIWTYNEQNMKDKFNSYIKNGFSPKLILDGVEHNI